MEAAVRMRAQICILYGNPLLTLLMKPFVRWPLTRQPACSSNYITLTIRYDSILSVCCYNLSRVPYGTWSSMCTCMTVYFRFYCASA